MLEKPTIDLKDTFDVEMCIAILRKCGGDHEFRNIYWNKVKTYSRVGYVVEAWLFKGRKLEKTCGPVV